MKNFILGGITVVAISFLGCYMFDLGRYYQGLKYMGVSK